MDLAWLEFLVEMVCAEPNGRAARPAVLVEECSHARPRLAADVMRFRRHDLPDHNDPGAEPLGYQASDAYVLAQRDAAAIAVHSFDFGTQGRAFRCLDAEDGGQVVVLREGAAHAFMTEDAGAGLQWFVNPACESEKEAQPLQSWLFFADDVQANVWMERVVQLTIAETAEDCPDGFSESYTRYILDRMELPLRRVALDGTTTTSTFTTQVIVSEHYGRGSILISDHLERFYFARGIGQVRWERWENLAETLRSDAEDMATETARNRRCPPLPRSEPPGPRWVLVDCRMWTSFVELKEPFAAADFGWPPELPLDRLLGGE